ncbi:Lipid A export ATP-binding/permease protein MsbA [Myxococcus hansupus]|uniref:Lipid A export ATP-binding/permease protein MsbA n=1 Tax=Pseudomyxococcus hansupus TaxID=1297742 RepID=A0A0H4WW61_9BACT|nr:ATP-binding cassette domain-containing protein [Myxococcus hansupus]AKQ65570.1 Lipid A export ATP-binding/permease protein MsbA [Myxococcus hansupus]
MTSPGRRRSIIPEVIQISATDCGPASLKSLFAGMGAELNYRVLREVCQTDVDGTSIVTLDEVANQLGLDSEQVMLPLDHVVVPEAKALPAIIVTLSAGGRPHFVVLWKRVGPFIQVMDPAAGRHWTRISTLLSHLYQHTTSVPAEGWREWAGSEEAVATFERRLLDLGATQARELVSRALEDPEYLSIARLDAACRASEAMIRAGAVRRGRTAAGLLQSMMAKDASGEVPIPATYWSVRPNPEVEGEVLMSGAVLMRVRGWREAPREGEDAPRAVLASDLATELVAKQVSPARTLLRLRGADSWVVPGLIVVGLVFATFGRILQALMLRGVLDLGRDLGTFAQRATGMAVLAGVALCFMLIQIPISLGLLGIGRRLEVRLRKAYFEKLPEMEDRYFQSRLASDMASRTHNIQAMRSLPPLLAQALVLSLEVVSITAALIWAAPHAWRIVLALAAVTLLVPLVAQKLLFEPDLRVQMHAGALSGFTLNALVGLTPIRIHGAERSLRRAQETLLVSWSKARYWLQTLSVGFEGGLMLGSYGLVMLLVYSYLSGTERASLVLLVVYWALRFPILGQRLMLLSRAFPNAMNRVRRLLDVIGDIKEPSARSEAPVQAPVAPAGAASGVSIVMEKVRVKGGGHTILDKVSLNIAPGEHVAVVGVSGAGKSTLVGLLLGWLRPARGEIKVDGQVLDQAAVERLRRTTAWVDPSISLWNQSLIDNLRYGNDGAQGWSLSGALKGAEMLDILEALPDGLQTSLGEGGGLVSGGQGQRVRLARAMLRSGVRLAILDEPFRGLDRDRRARLLAESRRLWADITLLCVTHDVEHTQEFDRVLVIENGRILENGPPKELLANKESRYSVLLRADQENRTLLWGGGRWRHWWLSGGQLVERPAPKPVAAPVTEPVADKLELVG